MSKLKGQYIKVENNCYKLVDHLKDGGNGSVWRATCNEVNYAIKFLNQKSKEKTQRFLKELFFCKKADHENLIKICDNGEYKGKQFYVMPFYKNTIADIISKETHYSNYFNYILQICEGISFIHSEGVIHRDIKPENILTDGNNVVLADLGIAHFEDSIITRENDLLANRPYAAPEQKKKGLSKAITKAVDVYALGCIINELFTKDNPAGTNFTLIADIYPWLSNLDILVERCMRQNPVERLGIDEIILELKLIQGESEEKLKEIRIFMGEDFEREKIELDSSILADILNRASEDILVAKYIFENKTKEETAKYNLNYNCDVHYKVNKYLKRLCFDNLLYKQCEMKFNYESIVYENGSNYRSLNLDFENDLEIYKELKSQMKKHGNIKGKTLKLFSSCCDYHCNEILASIAEIKKMIDDLDDAPILYITTKLMNILHENFIEIKDINIENHILINWELTINDFENLNIDFDTSLLRLNRMNNNEIEILKKFKERWGAIYSTSYNGYVIKFQDEESYNNFKNYSLKISKPYYIFEGDVLDLIKVERSYDGVIELKLLDSFEITNVLAKILGLRKDY